MKITKELRDASAPDLDKKLVEFKRELLKLNAQVASGTGVSNAGKLRQTKKNIARILTIVKERDMEI